MPNARFEKWRNNNFGFRGPDLDLEKPPGVTRVVCLGASESYGLYESAGKEWPAQLQEILPAREFQVVNASVVGLNIADYEEYTRKYVASLKPGILIVSANPLFYAVRQEREAGRSRRVRKQLTEETLPLFSIDQLRILPRLKEVVKEAAISYLPATFKAYQLGKLEEELAQIEQARLKGEKPKDIVPQRHVQNFRAELDAFLRFAKSHEIHVILTTYPTLISARNLQQYQEIFLDNRRFCIEYSLAGMVDILDRFNTAIRSAATEHGVGLIDVNAVVPKTTEYFGDNVHYTDRGARTIAEAAADVIAGRVPPATGSPAGGV